MTIKTKSLSIFASVGKNDSINELHIIAFTHRNVSLNEIGALHIAVENQKERLSGIKAFMRLSELMFLSTCNRVEFAVSTKEYVDVNYLKTLFSNLYPDFSAEQLDRYSSIAELHHGIDAVSHQLSVAASLDSMVVGEREIITQVRSAYDASKEMELSGDFLRILNRHTIQTAKKVYTETSIATKPVSVVSLAYHHLKDLNVPLDSRILIVGAGVTNTNMGRFLRKHGFTNFNVFNRTKSKAEKLANDLNGVGHDLSSLDHFDKGFDVIITCTGSENHLISPAIYQQLLQNETDKKIVIDIAIPQDLSPEIKANNKVTHISVEMLQKISNENLKARSKEIIHVEEILSEALTELNLINHNRTVELAMREVPFKVKEIKATAMNDVFHNELNDVDAQSRELIEKIVGYMEKKYMSVPMRMAKEILLKGNNKY